MKRFEMIVVVMLLSASGTASVLADETLDTLLPPPGWLRRNAAQLNVDESTKERIEELYQEKEPRYHQLKYKVERLAHRLYTVLAADDLDEQLIVKQMKALLEAESELKLHQVHVRVSLLSQVSSDQRLAARELLKEKPPATNWRGGIAAKVERIRELSKRLKDSGGSVTEVEKRMIKIDQLVAAGKVPEGVTMLDQVVHDLEDSLEK